MNKLSTLEQMTMAGKEHAQTQSRIFHAKDLLIRHFIILLLSIFFSSLYGLKANASWLSVEFLRKVIEHFVYIALIWNGDLFFLALIFKNHNWENRIARFLFISGAIAVLWPLTVHFTFNTYIYPLIHHEPCNLSSSESITYLITSITITLLVNTIFIAMDFFQFWRRTLTEKEELKRNSIIAEFEALKSQINPHFLFNSLNTLVSLIEENAKDATEFVIKLSNVYRYVLMQKDKELVPLREELAFIRDYIFLNKMRFGENLIANINVNEPYLNKQIATLSLQMLVENSIKHNVISKEKPLTIEIGIEQDTIVVRNNLQPKTQVTESSHIGLENIQKRYGYFTNKPVVIEKTSTQFSVSLPLLNPTEV